MITLASSHRRLLILPWIQLRSAVDSCRMRELLALLAYVMLSVPTTTLAAIDIRPSGDFSNFTLLTTPTIKDDYHFDCDGSRYGYRLDTDDCLSALDRIINTRDKPTFAERGTPDMPASTFPLPWRWMGSKFHLTRLRCSSFDEWGTH